MFLEDSKELRLQLEGNVTHFVEEQRAAIGELEPSNLLRDGAGEGALFMTEQLAFDQARRNCGAVQLDEGSRAAFAQVVDGAGDQLLAGTRFTLNQDR